MAKYASKTKFSKESGPGGLYREHESMQMKNRKYLKNQAETDNPGCLRGNSGNAINQLSNPHGRRFAEGTPGGPPGTLQGHPLEHLNEGVTHPVTCGLKVIQTHAVERLNMLELTFFNGG